jgi:hypothetical protein
VVGLFACQLNKYLLFKVITIAIVLSPPLPIVIPVAEKSPKLN